MLHVVNAVTGRYGGRIGLGDIKQGQSDVRSMLGPNSCRMFKPCQVYPDEHVCVSPQETRIFIGKMHVTVEHLVGELPAKFAAKFLSEVRSVSMRQSLQRRIRTLLDALIFLFKNNKTQPKFHEPNFTMHSLRSNKSHKAAKFSEILVAQFGLPICGAIWGTLGLIYGNMMEHGDLFLGIYHEIHGDIPDTYWI